MKMAIQGAFFMKLERLTYNKIKIFLTMDDLMDRGITKEDVIGNSLKAHKLFQDMVEEACEEMNLKISGSIAVEIFSLQAQGLVIIITKNEEDLLIEDEDFLDLDVRIDENPHILYTFFELEEVIQLSYYLKNQGIKNSTWYFLDGCYYLLLEKVEESKYDTIISLAAEYGHASTLTLTRLHEYGTCIVSEDAISVITRNFRR
jgi:adapter protein MecA 1/2